MKQYNAFAIIKGKAVSLGQTKSIIKYLKEYGFHVIVEFEATPKAETWRQHYQKFKNEPYFEDMVSKLEKAGQVVCLLLGLDKPDCDAIEKLHKLTGHRNPRRALPNTIRHKFGINVIHNAFHAADCKTSYLKDIHLWKSLMKK